MVISIILAICIPLTLGVEGFFIIKAYEMGVKSHKEEVEKENKNKEIEVMKVDEEKEKYFQEMLNEYIGL